MRRLLLAVVMSFIPVPLWSACPIAINVPGVYLNESVLAPATNALSQQGAEVVYFIAGPTENLDLDEHIQETVCTNMQSPNGGRKSTLVVLAVSPSSRKMGIYYGAAWKNALDSHWVRIKQDYMVPFFKNKDWSGGLAAAGNQIAERIKASKDEAIHPAVTTVTNQAVDYSGLWAVFGWVVGLGALGLFIYGAFVFIRRRRELREQISQAQQEAITERNRTQEAVDSYLSGTVKNAYKDQAVSLFDRLIAYESTNPYSNDLPLATYRNLTTSFKNIRQYLNGVAFPDPLPDEPRKPETVPNSVKSSKRRRAAASSNGGDTTVIAPVIINNEEIRELGQRVLGSSDSGGSSSWDSGSSSDSGGGFGGGDSGGGGGSSDF